jgi:hypothetical protein
MYKEEGATWGKAPRRAPTWGVKSGLILLVFFHPIPYSHSTPTGLVPFSALPQIFLKAIISRKQLLRFTLSRSARYCVSTPTGLGPSPAFPQVPPGAIISLRSLLRFIFNPYRGWIIM